MFDPDGDQAAADSTRSSTSLDTGWSVNPRTARRLVTASYTSMIAYLPPAIASPGMKHSGSNATSLVLISNSRRASGRLGPRLSTWILHGTPHSLTAIAARCLLPVPAV